MHTIRTRAVTGPALVDGFHYFIFRHNPSGQLEWVPWESKRVLSNPDDHAIIPSVPWRSPAGQVRIRCEICRQVFPGQLEINAHLPSCSVARYRVVVEGFGDFIARIIHQRGVLQPDEVEKLRGIMEASMSDEVFYNACARGYADYELGLTRYRVDWLLSFLSFIPHHEINPKTASREDHREALRVQTAFFRSRSKEQETEWQQRIIRELFAPGRPLQEVAKPGVGRLPIYLTPEEEKAFQKDWDKRGRKLAAGLERDGVKGALARYNENPRAFSEWVRPRKEIAKRHLAAGMTPPPTSKG